jgi:hypothetical protein
VPALALELGNSRAPRISRLMAKAIVFEFIATVACEANGAAKHIFIFNIGVYIASILFSPISPTWRERGADPQFAARIKEKLARACGTLSGEPT